MEGRLLHRGVHTPLMEKLSPAFTKLNINNAGQPCNMTLTGSSDWIKDHISWGTGVSLNPGLRLGTLPSWIPHSHHHPSLSKSVLLFELRFIVEQVMAYRGIFSGVLWFLFSGLFLSHQNVWHSTAHMRVHRLCLTCSLVGLCPWSSPASSVQHTCSASVWVNYRSCFKQFS